MKTGIALLGAGRIGQVHARAVAAQPDARLVAVSDALPEAANALAARTGCEVRSMDEIATSDDVDGVLICTPTNTHAELIEKYVRAGKAVFCEKPIDLNLGRVRACLGVVQEAGGKLMLGFNRRFDPHFAALRQAIVDGKIGAVEQVIITSRDPGLPPMEYVATSGGIFRDMTIHDFDMARFLLGEEIETVQASAAALVEPKLAKHKDFDTASVLMTTPSGKQCVIVNSRRATYGYDQRIEVHGSEGMVGAENQRAVSIELANAQGFTRPPLLDFFMSRYTEAYAAEIAAFIDAVRGNRPPSPGGADGEAALRLAEAAILSVAENRAVRLSEITA